MRHEDLVAFASRDWASIAESKEQYWAEQKASMTPTEAIRLGDALRAHFLAFRPAGPTPEERDEDLATHQRVAEMLNRVGTRRGQ